MTPLTLADGTMIDTSTGNVMVTKSNIVVVPKAEEAIDAVINARRRAYEIPAEGKEASTIALVGFYELYGLSEEEIALTLGITIALVASVRKTPHYITMLAQTRESMLEETKATVSGLFQAHSRDAAENLIKIANDPDNPKVALGAINSVLDRAGHRPVDVLQHKHSVDGGLRIEVIKTEKVGDIIDIKECFDDNSS